MSPSAPLSFFHPPLGFHLAVFQGTAILRVARFCLVLPRPRDHSCASTAREHKGSPAPASLEHRLLKLKVHPGP